MTLERSATYRPSSLLIRVLSGAAMLLAVVILIRVGVYGAFALALAIAAFSLWEFRGLSDRMGMRAPSWLIFPLGVYFVFSGTLLSHLDLTLVLGLCVVVGLTSVLFLRAANEGMARWAMGLGGALYIGIPLNFYLLLYTGKPSSGPVWTLFTILAVVVSDSAALLVGSRFGRHPFFARISPRKTIEGAIAGVLFPVLPMLLGIWGWLGLPVYHAILLGLLIGLSAEAGDLVESQMKRSAGVKDSSNLIPGHGGVLDRIDSVLFPPILVYMYATAWHLLS